MGEDLLMVFTEEISEQARKQGRHYYISDAILDAQAFLKRILQEWSVETMHFYKDCALHEDRCKTYKGAGIRVIDLTHLLNPLFCN